MKKILIATICILLMLGVCACTPKGNKVTLDGTYSNVQIGTGTTVTFNGDGITLKYTSAGQEVYTVSGTYEVLGDTIVIEFTGEDYEKAYIFAGTKSFELGDGYIIIDRIKYTKQ